MSNEQPTDNPEGWILVSVTTPIGADAISCEAWCAGDDDFPGPCIMSFDEDDRTWNSREDTGCWEPGEVTHWRPRAKGPHEAAARVAIAAKAART